MLTNKTNYDNINIVKRKQQMKGEQKNDSCRNGIKNNELWRNKNTL